MNIISWKCYTFLYQNQKNFGEALNVLTFWRFPVSKYYLVYISYETFWPVNGKNYSKRWEFSQIGYVGDIEYSPAFEEYKVIYLNGAFDYITKDDFVSSNHSFGSKFTKNRYKSMLYWVIVFEIPSLKMLLIVFICLIISASVFL